MSNVKKRKRSFVAGYLSGIAGVPFTTVISQGFVDYFYGPDQHRLPALPEWNTETHPYGCIALRNGVYAFFADNKPRTVSANGIMGLVYYNEHTKTLKEGQWVQSTAGAYNWTPIWTNHEIYYTDSAGGGLFLDDSVPDPVNEPGNSIIISDKAMMLGCKLGYIIHSSFGKRIEPVACLYNGVRLPTLPYVSFSYPYLCIYKRNSDNTYCLWGSKTPIYIDTSTAGYGDKVNSDVPCFSIYFNPENDTNWRDLAYNRNYGGQLLSAYTFVWCNKNIKKDGTVVHTASNPVPIYE